jgi:hypothetical protein
MRYVVFGVPLHVEAASEAEAIKIGAQHGLPSPIAMQLPEPILPAQGIRDYWVFDRSKDGKLTQLYIRAKSKDEAERMAKDQGCESPNVVQLLQKLKFK